MGELPTRLGRQPGGYVPGSRYPSAVEAGIFGLLGVLVGAMATGISTYVLARREDMLSRRTALRLLCTDLHKVRALIFQLRSDGEWGRERTPLPIDSYVAHKEILARSLSAAKWKFVEGSILGVQYLELVRAECMNENREFNAAEIADFKRIGQFIDRALEKLETESWAIDHSDGYQRELWDDR